MKDDVCKYCNLARSLVEESQKHYEKGFGWIHRDCYWKRQQDLTRRG